VRSPSIFRLLHSCFVVALLVSCSREIPRSPNEVPGYDNHRSAGASAHDILSDDDFFQINVEIQAVEGFEPTTDALDQLKTFLEARLNKTDIEIILDDSISSPGGGPYTLEQVQQIEADRRLHYTADDTVHVYFLFLDGASSKDDGDAQVLGYAHQNTSIAIFEKTIQDLSGGLLEPSTELVEATVLEHEMGHLMGLVNLGSEMQTQHQDTAHGAHCNVEECLMYYAADTSDALSNLLGTGAVPELDSHCLEDLAANGGK
jgi:hypothetical protein